MFCYHDHNEYGGSMMEWSTMKSHTLIGVWSCLLILFGGFISSTVYAGGSPHEGSKEYEAAMADEIQEAEHEPGYMELHRTGDLSKRGEALWALMDSCRLCPRECGANRLDGERGFCRVRGETLRVASHHAHFGEEQPLVGTRGSGTIFFSHCNLQCVFCQNWQISHQGRGQDISIERLAYIMLELQQRGCHNINLVTPTHYAAHIVKALDIAAEKGLRIPIVYNTSGWERLKVLKLLDGIVDIYLPDFKYFDSDIAAAYSAGAASYPEQTKEALLEMHRQVGTAKPAEDGIMYRGLMIRHLVMPNQIGDSKQILEWIAEHLPLDTYVNIMAQYRPEYKAFDYPELTARVTQDEYKSVIDKARELGLTNLDVQEFQWLPMQ